MAVVRRDYRDLSNAQQHALVSAVDQLHGTGAAAPAYRAFVQVHAQAMSMTGMSWRVHTMGDSPGLNFLSWHRHFLQLFEQRLRKVDSGLALPYWDWASDPEPPPFLSRPEELVRWSVVREEDLEEMPTKADVEVAFARKSFRGFQRKLELGAHADVHVALGGTMNSSSSPADPLFWLHHANIDRLWAQWQQEHPKAKVPGRTDVLHPFEVKVSSQLDLGVLGYSYA